MAGHAVADARLIAKAHQLRNNTGFSVVERRDWGLLIAKDLDIATRGPFLNTHGFGRMRGHGSNENQEHASYHVR